MSHTPAYSYVGWEDAFPGASPPEDGIAFYLRRLPKSWLIETLGKIGTTLFNSGSFFMNPNQQIAFIMSFKKEVAYAERLASFIAANSTRVFAHTNMVTALTRQALLHGSVDAGPVPGYAFDHLLRAIALFNSHFGRVRLVGESGREAFLPYELELMMEMKFNFSFAMARYYRFMDWAHAQPEDSDYYLPLERDFPRFFGGATYDSYAATALVISNPFMSQLDLGEWRWQRGVVDMGQWTGSLLDANPVAKQLDSLAIDIEGATRLLERHADSFGLADIRPFIDQPLLKLGNNVYGCPHQGFLRNKLGEGVYHGFFKGYKENDGDKVALRFSQFFGRFLEEDTFMLMRDGTARRSDVRLYPEHKYKTSDGEVKSPDIAFFAGPVAVFIEVTRKRLPLDEAICDRQPKAIADTIQDLFVRKARQLDRRIAEFRSGVLRYDGIDQTLVRRIFPIILTEQDFPQFIALPKMIRDAIGDANLLNGYEDVQFLSSEDAEALYLSAAGAMDLDGVLTRKAAMPNYVHRDLVTYLYDNERDKVRGSDESMPGYRELWQRAKAKLREWGMGGLD